jgi:5,10-methylene-tetrahydrofolate dehydrogenase/methenyl tetrahydrofolate cyclohydrolase
VIAKLHQAYSTALADPAVQTRLKQMGSNAAALTPVPGGVGPLTSALIFQNLIRAAERQQTDPTTR